MCSLQKAAWKSCSRKHAAGQTFLLWVNVLSEGYSSVDRSHSYHVANGAKEDGFKYKIYVIKYV